FLEGAGPRARADALPSLHALDRAVVAEGVLLSIGPVLAPDDYDADFGAWAAELIRTTRNVSFSARVASPERGASPRGVTAAGEAMAAIARATPGGIGNFRFAAAANVPAGTPFFPVAYHRWPGAPQSRMFSRACGSRRVGIPGSCFRCWKIRCWRGGHRRDGTACAICCCTRPSAAPGSMSCRYRATLRRIAWPP